LRPERHRRCPARSRVPLDQLDKLVDHGSRLSHLGIFTLERQPVAAQEKRDPQAVTQGMEDAVVDRSELGRDLVRDRQNFLQVVQSVVAEPDR